MRFSRRQWIEKIGHALGVAAYILVVFLPLAALAGQSAEWLAGGGGGDLGSGNGTLVNGVLISKPTELKSGDVLQIGQTRITVAVTAGQAGATPLPLEEPTQRRPAPQATQSHVRAAAMPTQVTPAPLRPAGTPVQTTPLRQAGRFCPHCGASLKPTSKFCPGCGKPVAPGAPGRAAAMPAPIPVSAPAATCPNCGEPLRPGVQFCWKCGNKLIAD